MKHVSSSALMPQPFDWVNIPAGNVTLGGSEYANGGYIQQATTFEVSAFSIAKYPITNAQFAKFIEADGYRNENWWTKDGWEEREIGNWVQLRFWGNRQWNEPNHPVVGVSWYEAIAFCCWLSEVTSENIILPIEQQWQRAAQGDTRWAYPYGDKFDETRCNFNTQGTIAVTAYEGNDKGDSPFGVVGMSGNVWEWCLTEYETGENQIDGMEMRVMRGGSWGCSHPDELRVDFRSWSFAESRDGGVRIARNYI